MFGMICALAAIAFVGAVAAYRFLDSSSLRYFLPRATLSVERVTIPIHALPQRLSGLKVVQLTDIHSRHNLDAPTRALWDRTVVTVRAERPDLVLVTGDLVDYDPTAIDLLVPMLQHLQKAARFGVFVVLGNHDYHFNPTASTVVIRALTAASIPVLNNATAYPFRNAHSKSQSTSDAASDANSGAAATVIDADAETLGLAIVGCGDLWGNDFHPERVLPAVPPGVPRIILSHNPDTAVHLRADAPAREATAKRWGVSSASAVRSDLILSGHTHGGQICFPSFTANRGAPVLGVLKWLDAVLPSALARFLPGRRYYGVVKRMDWMQGLHVFQPATATAAGSYLYVSRGLADIYRRLFCDPEITILTLVTASDTTAAAATAVSLVPPP